MNPFETIAQSIGDLYARVEKLENRPQPKDGAPGRDGERGERGLRGPAGAVTVVGNSELLAAVQQLKLEKTRYLAAVELQMERNMGRTHRGLRAAIANVLQTLKHDSEKKEGGL